MTIDHMYFDNYGSSASLGLTILDIDNSQPATENVGVGLYASLIGTFNILVPILDIISNPSSDSSPVSSVPFPTMYLDYPWTLPSSSSSDKYVIPTRMRMSLSVVEVVYQDTLDLAMGRRISLHFLLGKLHRHAQIIVSTVFFLQMK